MTNGSISNAVGTNGLWVVMFLWHHKLYRALNTYFEHFFYPHLVVTFNIFLFFKKDRETISLTVYQQWLEQFMCSSLVSAPLMADYQFC